MEIVCEWFFREDAWTFVDGCPETGVVSWFPAAEG